MYIHMTQTAHRFDPNPLEVAAFPLKSTSPSIRFTHPYGKLLLFWQQSLNGNPSVHAANSHSAAFEMKAVSPHSSIVTS